MDEAAEEDFEELEDLELEGVDDPEPGSEIGSDGSETGSEGSEIGSPSEEELAEELDEPPDELDEDVPGIDVGRVTPSSDERSDSPRLTVMGTGRPSVVHAPARNPAHAVDVPSEFAVAVTVTRSAPLGADAFSPASSAAPSVGTLLSWLSKALSPRDSLCGLLLSVAVTTLLGTTSSPATDT